MRTKIEFKKIGNHWYPNINHIDPTELIIESKIERILSRLDIFELGIVEIYLTKLSDIVDGNILQIDDQDITTYLTTTDYFIMSIFINDHRFRISSDLYYALEEQFNFNFHNTLYKIELW